jgi:glycosyltransferase involved in cell wall biosynthesis
VHAHFTSPSADVGLLVAALGGWRFSFTAHGTDIVTDLPARLAAKVRAADAVVCVSDVGRAQLMMGVAEEHWDKLAVVRCGVDAGTFAPAAAPREDADPSAPLRVLCVGRLAPEKGQQVLVDALAACPGVAVTFVGAGDKLEALRRRAAARGVDDRVTFTGAVGQDRIAAHYAAADVFCLPSFGEGVPVVLMEAMASGVPVVATAVGGVPELVEHGVTGLLAPPGRADALADALMRLAGDADLRRRLAAAGRARVEEEFDLERNAERLRAVLLGTDPAGDRELTLA